jgi:hypothetical protein
MRGRPNSTAIDFGVTPPDDSVPCAYTGSPLILPTGQSAALLLHSQLATKRGEHEYVRL